MNCQQKLEKIPDWKKFKNKFKEHFLLFNYLQIVYKNVNDLK